MIQSKTWNHQLYIYLVYYINISTEMFYDRNIFKVYYPVRHHLVQHMVGSIQRLGFSPTATLEHRKLAVELAEVIIKWEVYGIKEETETTEVSGVF